MGPKDVHFLSNKFQMILMQLLVQDSVTLRNSSGMLILSFSTLAGEFKAVDA